MSKARKSENADTDMKKQAEEMGGEESLGSEGEGADDSLDSESEGADETAAGGDEGDEGGEAGNELAVAPPVQGLAPQVPASESAAERSEGRRYVAYTVKLPSDQLAALQSIWLELKRLYGTHSPDKSGMIEAAISAWLKRWDGPEHDKLLRELLEIRENTRRRQYKKGR